MQLYSLKSVNFGDTNINQINNPDKEVFESKLREKQPLVTTNILNELSFTSDELDGKDSKQLKKKIDKHFKYYLVPLNANHTFNIYHDKINVATHLVQQSNQRLLIVVITGIKKIILFNPDQTKYLYKSKISPNKSEVNFWNYSTHTYPDFSKSNYVEIIMKQNQMLYIPTGWWWTSKTESECVSVVCKSDSIFSFIFKKMGII